MPIKPTGNVALYYLIDRGEDDHLNLFSYLYSDFSGTQFQMYYGVLGTFTHPDDSAGFLPYNATTPESNTSPALRNQAVAHAGYDLINNTFLAVHGVQDNKWWLCNDDGYGLDVIIYEAKASRGCKATYIAVYP